MNFLLEHKKERKNVLKIFDKDDIIQNFIPLIYTFKILVLYFRLRQEYTPLSVPL